MIDDVVIAGSDTAAPINVAKRIGVIRRFVDVAGLKVLDAGCGAGSYVEALRALGADVRGVEYLADKVAEWDAKHPGDETVRQGDLTRLDFADDSFDMILLNEVLEHVPDDTGALRELLRVLKPGGTFILLTPNRYHPVETHGIVFRKSRNHVSGLRVPFQPWLPVSIGEKYFVYWARNYWPGELAKMTTDAGFTIVHRGFVWQTFENLAGGKPRLVHRVAPLARFVSNLCEKLPLVRRFGVSQLIVATKPAAA